MTRLIKSPSQLKRWRELREEREEQLRVKYEAHERKMMMWAVENAIYDPNVLCPDGIVRTVPHDIWMCKYNGKPL